MTEIEKAIIELINARESDCLLDYPSNKTLETALEALREKAEREKGCECCNGFHPSELDAKIYVWGVRYYEVGNGEFRYVESSFCPMCGRRLK